MVTCVAIQCVVLNTKPISHNSGLFELILDVLNVLQTIRKSKIKLHNSPASCNA